MIALLKKNNISTRDSAGAESYAIVENNDTKSIDFSVDSKMLEKLGLAEKIEKKALNGYEQEKVFNFQLEKDLKKLQKVKGDNNNTHKYKYNITVVSTQ